MKLTMIRHGDTEATLRRLYYGSTDLALLPQSAQALAANAARYPKALLLMGFFRSVPDFSRKTSP